MEKFNHIFEDLHVSIRKFCERALDSDVNLCYPPPPPNTQHTHTLMIVSFYFAMNSHDLIYDNYMYNENIHI